MDEFKSSNNPKQEHKKMAPFNFDLGDVVVIICSLEFGTIIARADYAEGENQYLVRYKAGDGRAVESWWGESALALK